MCMYLCICVYVCVYIHKIQFQARRYLVRERENKGFILTETKNIPPHLLIAISLSYTHGLK